MRYDLGTPFGLIGGKIINQVDRELSESVKKKRKKKLLVRMAIGVLVFVIIVFSFMQLIRPTIRSGNFSIASVETGDVLATVSASGTVLPEFEEIKTSPISSRNIKIYQSLGSKVETGDTILTLDINSSSSALEKLKDEKSL